MKLGVEWTGTEKMCVFPTENWPYLGNGER